VVLLDRSEHGLLKANREEANILFLRVTPIAKVNTSRPKYEVKVFNLSQVSRREDISSQGGKGTAK